VHGNCADATTRCVLMYLADEEVEVLAKVHKAHGATLVGRAF
jgi:predicted small metal-binding protein